MPAPTPGMKPTPSGIRLDDGMPTVIGLAGASNLGFWEKTTTPPGFDGGAPIDTTTMHNTEWRTMAPRKLKSMTDMSIKVAYDPLLMSTIKARINKKDTITTFFPDGSTWAYYGFIREFKPDALEEGKQPEATLTITVTNTDPTDGSEQAPVYTDVPGS